MIDVAKRTAQEVGELLRHRWLGKSKIRFKGPVDLVTDTDVAAEELAVRLLREACPDYGIVAEEGHAEASSIPWCWYVDPLDGTTNFAHGHPQFAVSIALARENQVEVGVVYDPLRDELFSAALGRGALLNDHRIEVSTTPSLDGGLLATGFPYDRRQLASYYLQAYERFLRLSQGIRRAGSAALDICYVACGRLDGFWERSLKPWDTAAATLIASEAGATVSDFSGNAFCLQGTEVLVSNGRIQPEMLRVLGPLTQ